jgi:hypothetical protein
MKTHPTSDFSSVPSTQSDRSPRTKNRLLLGLTARHLRSLSASAISSLSARGTSGLHWGSLDRLQPVLTRYHE